MSRPFKPPPPSRRGKPDGPVAGQIFIQSQYLQPNYAAVPSARIPEEHEKPDKEEVAIVDDQEEDEPWVWEGPDDGEFSEEICKSLKWVQNYKDPDGMKMNRKQVKDSFKNFDKWFDEFVEKEYEKQRKIDNLMA